MKLVVIWLLGVPLAVAAMCTAAALWPRGTSAEASRAPHAVPSPAPLTARGGER
jgi:hypothetical protein